jgi:hypothetical protein
LMDDKSDLLIPKEERECAQFFMELALPFPIALLRG